MIRLSIVRVSVSFSIWLLPTTAKTIVTTCGECESQQRGENSFHNFRSSSFRQSFGRLTGRVLLVSRKTTYDRGTFSEPTVSESLFRRIIFNRAATLIRPAFLSRGKQETVESIEIKYTLKSTFEVVVKPLRALRSNFLHVEETFYHLDGRKKKKKRYPFFIRSEGIPGVHVELRKRIRCLALPL